MIGFVRSKLLMHPIVQALVDGVVDFLERCVFPNALFSQRTFTAYFFTAAVALHLVPLSSDGLFFKGQDGLISTLASALILV